MEYTPGDPSNRPGEAIWLVLVLVRIMHHDDDDDHASSSLAKAVAARSFRV
jgi:hypothetical protein